MLITFDQSSSCSGHCVMDKGEVIECGFTKPTDKDYMERINKMKLTLLYLVDRYHPEAIAMEDIFKGRNFQTYKKLSQLQGIFINTIRDLDIPYRILSPSSWRKVVGIKGDDKKQQAIDFVAGLNIYTKVDDVAEAVCMAVAFNKLREINL